MDTRRRGPNDPTTRHTIDYRKSARGVEAPARHDIATFGRRVVGQGPVDETASQGREPTPSDSAHPVASTPDRAAQWFVVHDKLHEIRGRWQKAKARGQVEMHLGIDAVDFLLSLAQPTVNAGLKQAGLKPAGVTVAKVEVPRG